MVDDIVSRDPQADREVTLSDVENNLKLAGEKVTHLKKLLEDALKDEEAQIKIKIELLTADIKKCDDPTKTKQLEAELIKAKGKLKQAKIREEIKSHEADIRTSNDPTKYRWQKRNLKGAQAELLRIEYKTKPTFSERFSQVVKQLGAELTSEFEELLESNDQPYLDSMYQYAIDIEGSGNHWSPEKPDEYNDIEEYIMDNYDDEEVKKKLLDYLYDEHRFDFEVIVY